MLKLEDLQVDTHVAGIEPSTPVKLLYVKKAGDDAADVTYELLDGGVLKKTVFRADEAKLEVASETRGPPQRSARGTCPSVQPSRRWRRSVRVSLIQALPGLALCAEALCARPPSSRASTGAFA